MKEMNERLTVTVIILYKYFRGINRNAILVVERDEMRNSLKIDMGDTSL